MMQLDEGSQPNASVGAGPPVAPSSAPVIELSFDRRYAVRRLLGKGGMGTVELCHDALVGRDIAMKRMRPELGGDDFARARFVREARVQGQLEHPAIVPVHTLGVAADGGMYFTMKRVRGETLADILVAQANGDAEAERRHPLHRLLAAFGQICLAVDFAHERGVIHRDLKPPNVMIGDYGEVLLLDWGIAQVGAPEPVPAASDAPPPSAAADAETIVRVSAGSAARTAAGVVFGTPGYLAPELLVAGGVPSRKTDVYALGVILYETLTKTRMLTGRIDEMYVAQVVDGVERPSKRADGIDPELDAICMRAIDPDPDKRYPTARALYEDLDGYLAGRRDDELRREAAAEHAALAERAASEALDRGDDALRERAMREAGRALALQPDNARAMRTIALLLTTPPPALPAEVKEGLARDEARRLRQMSRIGIVAYLLIISFFPVIWKMGIRSWWMVFVPGPIGVVVSFLCWRSSRSARAQTWRKHAIMVLGCASIAAVSLCFGPYLVVPGLLAGHTMSLLLTAHKRERTLYLALCFAAFFVPVVLQWTGVFPAFEAGPEGIIILPNMAGFERLPTEIALFLGSLASMFLPMLLVARVSRELDESRENGALRQWHLGKLVPETADSSAPAHS